MTPVWVSLRIVLAFQEQLLKKYGGASGIRDHGLLESALAKPENLFAYGQPTYFDLAASYASGLIRNHPFLDGNKRIGFTVAIYFLEVNGHDFRASNEEVVARTLALASHGMTETEYAAWLEANSGAKR